MNKKQRDKIREELKGMKDPTFNVMNDAFIAKAPEVISQLLDALDDAEEVIKFYANATPIRILADADYRSPNKMILGVRAREWLDKYGGKKPVALTTGFCWVQETCTTVNLF